MSKWSERYSQVIQAQRTGVLRPVKEMKCQQCGRQAEDKHHEDYSKPLDVVYLCRKCHFARHVEIGSYALRQGKQPHYNFSRIPTGSYAVIKNQDVSRVSPLVGYYSRCTNHTELFKCFAAGEDVVVFRIL